MNLYKDWSDEMTRINTFFLAVLITTLVSFPKASMSELPEEWLLYDSSISGGKVGYVEVGRTFDEYERTKRNHEYLEKIGEEKEKERKVIVDEIEALKIKGDKYAITEKEKELEKYDVSEEKVRVELRRVIIQAIFNDIDGIVQALGKKEGYSKIYNEKAKHVGNNLTDKVLEILNSKFLNGDYEKVSNRESLPTRHETKEQQHDKAVDVSSEDVITQLERLAKLKEGGFLSDEEFEAQKKAILTKKD